MADALLSPAVGGTMWIAATTMGYCCKKISESEAEYNLKDASKIDL